MCEICQRFNPFQVEWLHAGDRDGAADAPADTATTVALRPGQSLTGLLERGDEDWIRLEVTPGQDFTVTTSDGSGSTIKDTFLVLYDHTGRVVALDDDDGPGFHAQITHTATGSLYYAAVTTFEAHYNLPATSSGTYTLSLAAAGGPDPGALTHWSSDQIADQLVRGYWEDSGRAARGFDLSVEGGRSATIHVDTSALTAEGRWFAEQALEIWSAVSGLTFTTAAPPAGRPVGIRFDDENSGAYASTTLGAGGKTANVFINISRAWIAGDHYDFESYALQTYLHEIGHALGLGHAGGYDIGDGVSVTYGEHAEFANDSWQATVMSYFSQQENTRIDASRAYLLTPMAADILAVQELYGISGRLRTGDTVYGVGSTAGDAFDHLEDRWGAVAFTLVDDGGIDTLNVSTTAADQTIRLRPESYSDLGGKIGNMQIARGTMIENVVSGSGDDRIDGNGAANRLSGGAGADSLDGAAGNDRLLGGAGADRLEGAAGRDRLLGHGGEDRLEGGPGKDRLIGGPGRDRLDGGPGDDLLIGGRGADTFVFAPGGGSDRILDFRAGADRLDLRAWAFDSFADLERQLRDTPGGMELRLAGGATLRLEGLNPARFDADDVLL